MAFKTPNNAARRLLSVIEAIEADIDTDEHDSSHDEEAQMRAHEKVLTEIANIKKYVEDLDDKYEDLRYDYKLDL